MSLPIGVCVTTGQHHGKAVLQNVNTIHRKQMAVRGQIGRCLSAEADYIKKSVEIVVRFV